jgi:hypothetical protein
MSVKAIDIIRPALRRIGAIGATEQPSAKQVQVGLDALNGILDTLSVMPTAGTRPIESIVSLAAGAPYLTIGSGMQINVPRPDRIESAYARAQGLDESVRVVSKQIFDGIDQKTLGSTWPEVLWYDKGLPTGKVYIWPLAASVLEMHITTRGVLAQFASANDAIDLPGGALRALRLKLAVEVAPEFNLPVSASLDKEMTLAMDAFQVQNVEIPELELDGAPAIRTRLGQFLSGGDC